MRQVGAAAVGADLGHEEDLVAPALEPPAEPVLGPAVPVFPAVVEKGDAGIDGLVDEPDGLLHGFEIAEVMAAEPQRRHLDAGAAERPLRNLAACHGNLRFRATRGRADCVGRNNDSDRSLQAECQGSAQTDAAQRIWLRLLAPALRYPEGVRFLSPGLPRQRQPWAGSAATRRRGRQPEATGWRSRGAGPALSAARPGLPLARQPWAEDSSPSGKTTSARPLPTMRR